MRDFLLTLAYLSVARGFCDWVGNSTNPTVVESGGGAAFIAWAFTLAVALCAVIMFKLDMYVDKAHMWLIKLCQCAAPCVAAAAASVWRVAQAEDAHAFTDRRTSFLADLLAIFACLMHLVGYVVLTLEVWPVSSSRAIPLSWRTVQYIDVFGWFQEFSESQRAVTNEQSPSDRVRPLQSQASRVAARFGTDHTDLSVPWSCFSRASVLASSLWGLGALWIALLQLRSFMQRTKSTHEQSLVLLTATWPNALAPASMSCSDSGILFGDGFKFYLKQWNQEEESGESWSLNADFYESGATDIPWAAATNASSMAALTEIRGQAHALMLDIAGTSLLELALALPERSSPPSRAASAAAGSLARRPLGVRLAGERLIALASPDGGDIASACGRAPAVIGCTASGKLVLLCRLEDRWEPARVLAKLPRSLLDASSARNVRGASSGSAVGIASASNASVGEGIGSGSSFEILGVQVDSRGFLWVLTTRRSGSGSAAGASETSATAGAELLSFEASGAVAGRWKLPAGRRWARGLCALPWRFGFLLASELPGGGRQARELWHLPAL
eukprot:TRINITY_DN28640_c0_g1_i1.p1 TRINITY_DN28640_c0_g1~~TRINITY_DN28640_c0_g1_i1.p1  ORF type:complete len:648 (+),score=108.24 TRINITY_DN28640_c0_g1_i1:265-1944(+)